MRKKFQGFILFVLIFVCFVTVGYTQEQPQNVGDTFKVSIPYDKTYDNVLNYLKKQNYTFESASKDIGQIITNLSEINDGMFSSSAIKLEITLIKESEKETTIKVAVANWGRNKAKMTGWSKYDINADRSAKLAKEIKASFETSSKSATGGYTQEQTQNAGDTFKVRAPFDRTYDNVLNYLKKQNYTFESASKDIGQIITNLSEINDGMFSSSAIKLEITLIKESEKETTIKVAVANWGRNKAKMTGWSKYDINADRSAKLAKEIKASL